MRGVTTKRVQMDEIFQSVMDLEQGFGAVTAKVDRLVDGVKSLEGKIDIMRRQLARAGGIVAAAIFIASLLGQGLVRWLFGPSP